MGACVSPFLKGAENAVTRSSSVVGFSEN